VKSKARELKVAQQETGNKENKLKPLNVLESTLLDIIGRVVVNGMTGVAQFGIGKKKVIFMNSKYNKIKNIIKYNKI